jgi:hypothetical protein
MAILDRNARPVAEVEARRLVGAGEAEQCDCRDEEALRLREERGNGRASLERRRVAALRRVRFPGREYHLHPLFPERLNGPAHRGLRTQRGGPERGHGHWGTCGHRPPPVAAVNDRALREPRDWRPRVDRLDRGRRRRGRRALRGALTGLRVPALHAAPRRRRPIRPGRGGGDGPVSHCSYCPQPLGGDSVPVPGGELGNSGSGGPQRRAHPRCATAHRDRSASRGEGDPVRQRLLIAGCLLAWIAPLGWAWAATTVCSRRPPADQCGRGSLPAGPPESPDRASQGLRVKTGRSFCTASPGRNPARGSTAHTKSPALDDPEPGLRPAHLSVGGANRT